MPLRHRFDAQLRVHSDARSSIVLNQVDSASIKEIAACPVAMITAEFDAPFVDGGEGFSFDCGTACLPLPCPRLGR